MEQLKITSDDLAQMCRLCLSRDMTMDDVFRFSSELGKAIADVIMECAPVHITRHDMMPTNICRLCFTQLKTFHQFQMQAVRSDRTLQRYLEQLSDCHPQIKVELALEEPFDNSVSRNYNADVTTKCEAFEINDELNNFFPKQEVLANFTPINQINYEISLKSEIKDEPVDDNSLIPAECAAAVETQSICDGSEISCEDSVIKIGNSKVGNSECPIKFEFCMTGKIAVKSEETFKPLKEGDSSLCSENIKDDECLRSNEDNANRIERPSKRQNLNEMCNEFCNVLLKKSATSTGGKSYQCDICQKCFKYACQLKSHILKHTGEKPYKCDICKMCFRRSYELKTHKLKHTGEKPYQCEICKMCFRLKVTLKNHNLKHTGEKPYRCDICEMCFRRSDDLKNHKLKHTGEKPYQCDICKICFRHSNSLKSHKLKHTGEKPYQCEICKMCFSESGILKRHKSTHTGEKPYQCEICKMCFSESGILRRHKLTHTGEKPYQCEICKMCFRHLNSLKRHKLKHTGEKPYQCDICEMCFRQTSHLQSHKLMHTGEKPHQCDICKMCFTQASNLKQHKLKHTGEKPYRSDIIL